MPAHPTNEYEKLNSQIVMALSFGNYLYPGTN